MKSFKFKDIKVYHDKFKHKNGESPSCEYYRKDEVDKLLDMIHTETRIITNYVKGI